MKPYISMITLGVTDLHRAIRFYQQGLGLYTQGIVGEEFAQGTVAFFDLQQGLKLALWPRQSLAEDAGLALNEAPAAMSLAQNVLSEKDVDKIMQQASMAGAKIIKPPQPTFWGGYAGYFQDPDGHLWEIVWNPDFLPDQDK